jgi:excisionase family DNA binding protein
MSKVAHPTVLSDEWLSVQETISALGVSLRTVQKLAKNQQLRFKRQPRPGLGPERVYHAGDVDRLRQERPAVEKKPASPGRTVAVRPKAAVALRHPPVEIEAARLAWERERWKLESVREKLWLSPREIAKGWGLPSGSVIELCESGRLVGLRCGKTWRIRRDTLETFTG